MLFWLGLRTGLSLPCCLRAFADGYGIMALLMVGFLLKAAIGPVDQLLAVSGSPRLVAVVLPCTALLNVALNVALIPIFGSSGAARATVLSIAASNGLLAVVMYRRFGVGPFVLDRPRG